MSELLFDELLAVLQADPAVIRGMTFGHRAAKLGRRVFACDVDGDLVVKLGRERVDELVAAGRATRFDPMGGRPTRATSSRSSSSRAGRASS